MKLGGIWLLLAALAVCGCDSNKDRSEDEDSESADDDAKSKKKSVEADEGDDAKVGDGPKAGSGEQPPSRALPVQPPSGTTLFGALAWSESTKTWFVAVRRTSGAAAQRDALEGCGKPDCQVKAEVPNGHCIAVASAPGGATAWGWNQNRATAEQRALQECNARGSGCSLQNTFCNSGTPVASTAGASPQPPPAAPPPAAPAPGPRGRSPMPTSLDEWNAVGEVTVVGSSALNCETKMVREWLRVSCRKKRPGDPEPTDVSFLRGGDRSDISVFASGGVTSVIVPFIEGVHFEIRFSWTGFSKVLEVFWPRGAPEPQAKGRFR